MDISFQTEEGKFNYRVCGIVIADGKILAMKDERSPYYYLPGGRVMMGETAEQAIIREIREELACAPTIQRPLWLNQAFFVEDVEQTQYHEICLYFLLDITDTDILSKGKRFTMQERHHTHIFEWLALERLQNEYFYPLFLKKEIFRLPDVFTIRTEIE